MTAPAAAPAALTAFQSSLDPLRIYAKGRLPEPAGPAAPGRVRIVSWNIERGRDPARIGAALRALRPDVACLQEVDWGNRRTGGADVLQLLAEATGMLGLFGTEFLELDGPERAAGLAGGGAIGNALLTRLEPAATFRIELPACVDWERGAADPRLPAWLRRRLRREPRRGGRFGIGAEFAVGPHRLVLCSLHIEDKHGGVRGRWSQFAAAAEALERRRDSAGIGIIAGDFNTFDSRLARLRTRDTDATALGRPAGVAEAAWWQTALLPPTGYADPFSPKDWTFRLWPVFRAKLDWIAVRGGAVRDRSVGPPGLSDHRPLWIDLDLARGPQA
jgi:endonuclease/exonuclease/phosphatase family metal-dependent hydrolase